MRRKKKAEEPEISMIKVPGPIDGVGGELGYSKGRQI